MENRDLCAKQLPFKLSPVKILDAFDESFDEGAAAALADTPYSWCPHGLPEFENWTQFDVFMTDDPKQAGWLLGWWAGHFLFDHDPDGVLEGKLDGAAHMAALLWYGRWRLGRLIAFVEECAIGARNEKLTRELLEKKSKRPTLTVHSNPSKNTEGDRGEK